MIARPKPLRFKRHQRRRAARTARNAAWRPSARALLRAQVRAFIDEGLIIEPGTGFAHPRHLPMFESEWTPLGRAIPDYYTDNEWRAGQSEWRAKWGLAPMDPYPETPDIGIFCAPFPDQTLPEDPAADGTEAHPWGLISSARDAAIDAGPGAIVGIKTGMGPIEAAIALDDTENFLQINNVNLVDSKWVCWFDDPGERRPTIVRRMSNFGENPEDWDEIDPHADEDAGFRVATDGVYDPLHGSTIWHLNTVPTGVAAGIWAIAYAQRDSILTLVDLDDVQSFKDHGIDSEHVHRLAVDDDGLHDSVIPGNTPGSSHQVLDQDRQFCVTRNGGVLVKSLQNPALRWGGVYLVNRFHVGVSITTNGVFWGNALQFEYCGIGMRLNVNAGNTLDDVVVEGVYTRLCAFGYYFASGTNSSPGAGLGSVHNGSVYMGAPGNETEFGNGTTPWITNCRIEHVRTWGSFCAVSERFGWIRGLKEFDIRTHGTRLENGNSAYSSSIFAWDYDEYNERFYFFDSCLDCGTGQFGDTDGGNDWDPTTTCLRLHHGRIQHSLRAGQISDGFRGCIWYMVEALDVVYGCMMGGIQENGGGEAEVSHCRIVLSRRSDWHTCNNSNKDDLEVNYGVKIERRAMLQVKGPLNDHKAQVRNNFKRVRNTEIDLGTADQAEAYAIIHDGIIGAAAWSHVGIWEDTGGGLSDNGMQVPPGQTQRTELKLVPMDGLRIVGFTDSDHIAVDQNLDPSALQLAQITNLQIVATSGRNEDGTLSETSEAAARGGNTFLNSIMEGPDEPWLQPGVSRRDVRLLRATGNENTAVGHTHFYDLGEEGKQMLTRAAAGAPAVLGWQIKTALGAARPIAVGESFTDIGMYKITGTPGVAYTAGAIHPALTSGDDVNPRALLQSSTGNRWTASVTNNAGSAQVAGSAGNVVRTMNVWSGVAMVYNATTDKVSIYTYDETTGAQSDISSGTVAVDAALTHVIDGANNASATPMQGQTAWRHVLPVALTELQCQKCWGIGAAPAPQEVGVDALWSLLVGEDAPIKDSVSGIDGAFLSGSSSGNVVAETSTAPVMHLPNNPTTGEYEKPLGATTTWLQTQAGEAFTDFEFARNPISDKLMMSCHDAHSGAPRAVMCFIDEENNQFEDMTLGPAQYVIDTDIASMTIALKGPAFGLRGQAPGWAVYYVKVVAGVNRLHRATPTVDVNGRPTAWTIAMLGSNVGRVNCLPSQDATRTWCTVVYGGGESPGGIQYLEENVGTDIHICANTANAGFRHFGVAMDPAGCKQIIITTHTEAGPNLGEIQASLTNSGGTIVQITDDAASDGVKFDPNGFFSTVYSPGTSIDDACYMTLVGDRKFLRFYKPDGAGGVVVHRDADIEAIAAEIGLTAVEEFFGQSPEPVVLRAKGADYCLFTIKDAATSGTGSGTWNQSAVVLCPMDAGPSLRISRTLPGILNHEGEYYVNAFSDELTGVVNSLRGSSWKIWFTLAGIRDV